LACSKQWEEPSFYRSGRWPKGEAEVIVVVAVPTLRRGVGWASWVAAALVMTNRLVVARQWLSGDGKLDGKGQARAASHRR
jgi:hypothetical protein